MSITLVVSSFSNKFLDSIAQKFRYLALMRFFTRMIFSVSLYRLSYAASSKNYLSSRWFFLCLMALLQACFCRCGFHPDFNMD